MSTAEKSPNSGVRPAAAAARILQIVVRTAGVALLVLGGLFWSGRAFNLIPLHMLLGLVLVLALWGLSLLGARAKAPAGLVSGAALWGLFVPFLGVMQDRLLIGSQHWLVRVAHLGAGLVAMGFAEALARRVREDHA